MGEFDLIARYFKRPKNTAVGKAVVGIGAAITRQLFQLSRRAASFA